MICWICNQNEANSEEHKFKASDIRRNFGKKFDAIYYNGSLHSFHSEKDKIIKFPKVICIDCNNNKTRDADDAYTEFFENFETINSSIESNDQIDYEKIFGIKWKEKKVDLYRYFAKHAGCKIITGNTTEKIDLSKLSAFILGSTNIDNFYLKIYFNPVTKAFTNQLKTLKGGRYKSNDAFGSTIYLIKDNNLLFCGCIIKGSLRIEWFYSNNNSFNKKNNFEMSLENVIILNNEEFYPKSFYDFKIEDQMTYLNFGKFYLNEELEYSHYSSEIDELLRR